MYTAEERRALRETDPFRNVLPEFQHLSDDGIRARMKEIALSFVSLCENLVGDFNISQIIRTTNAFAMEGVSICGRRRYDPRGAVGTQHYISLNHFSDSLTAIDHYRKLGYGIVAAEFDEKYRDTMVALPQFDWPDRVAVLFGEEGRGLSPEAISNADVVVYVPQRGSVPSLNVAGTAHIMMYDYIIKKGAGNAS